MVPSGVFPTSLGNTHETPIPVPASFDLEEIGTRVCSALFSFVSELPTAGKSKI